MAKEKTFYDSYKNEEVLEINEKLKLPISDYLKQTQIKFDKKGEPILFENKTKQEKSNETLVEIYRNLIEILKEWCDLRKDYYNIISLWIMGTYFHNEFPSYPYLFLNAMRGSGKTRLLKLITHLSKKGALLNSLTEAELFRSDGTLGIDEFEGINRKGIENLRELLNSCYKKGTKVRRMRKVHTKEGDVQQVEQFEVYRPITIANITGMEDVLSDRCLTLIIEKSSKLEITNLMEIFEHDHKINYTKELLNALNPPKNENQCSLCSVVSILEVYKEWNFYIKYNYTNYNKHTENTNYTNYTQLYERVKSAGINGRELELSFPLLLISNEIGELETTLECITKIMQEKREDAFTENRDISLYDFLSQEIESPNFLSVNELTRNFKEFLNTNDEEINSKWMGRALKRLNLIIEKRRVSRGVNVKINFKKAKEKVRMFK